METKKAEQYTKTGSNFNEQNNSKVGKGKQKKECN
jgi:hypothetical protein